MEGGRVSATGREPSNAARAGRPEAPGGAALPDVYEDAAIYDRVYAGLDFDLAFWSQVARDAHGPVLDLACGTGRVTLPLLEQGVDVDGLDLHPAMIEALRRKAAARGFRPRLVRADMTDFTMPRRYARILCAFNAFAHADTTAAQLATLACCRDHLEAGGALVMHMSYPSPSYWAERDEDPVLEQETPIEGGARRLQMWDTRTKDVIGQRQHSEVEYRELDAAGNVVSSRRYRTTQRWVYRYELELLFRVAGFARSEIQGGFAGEPFERDDQQMVAWAWKD